MKKKGMKPAKRSVAQPLSSSPSVLYEAASFNLQDRQVKAQAFPAAVS